MTEGEASGSNGFTVLFRAGLTSLQGLEDVGSRIIGEWDTEGTAIKEELLEVGVKARNLFFQKCDCVSRSDDAITNGDVGA